MSENVKCSVCGRLIGFGSETIHFECAGRIIKCELCANGTTFELERLRLKLKKERETQEELVSLRSAVSTLEEKLREAEKQVERREHDIKMLLENGQKETDGLRAEVEEWKKKAEVWESEFVRMNVAFQKETLRTDGLLKELRALRLSTIRVDVLLRWIESRARRVRQITGDVKEAEIAVVLMRWLPLVLARRSTTNTNGE